MKKTVLLFFLTAIVCLLTACSTQGSVTGKITETYTDANGRLCAVAVQTDDNTQIGILLDDMTPVFIHTDGPSYEKFMEGTLTDLIVTAEYDSQKQKMKMKDAREIPAYTAKQIEITGFMADEPEHLSDGTEILVWHYAASTAYVLQNGTELLRVQAPTGPENTHVGGIEGYDDLPKEAQKNVSAFFNKQGLLYDVPAILDKAHADCVKMENSAAFQSHMLSQDISPTASNENVMWFLTTVSLSSGTSSDYTARTGAAFDKKQAHSSAIGHCSPARPRKRYRRY